MNNSLIAKVLHANNLVTKDQIQKYWSQSSEEHNIGLILVENGELDAAVYEQVVAFVAQNTAANPVPPATAEPVAESTRPEPEVAAPTAAPSHAEVAESAPPRIGNAPRPAINSEEPTMVAPSAHISPNSSADFQVEGNNFFGASQMVEVEEIAGLQDTRMSDFSTLSTAAELVNDTQWIFDHGLQSNSQVAAALVPGVESGLAMLLATARKNKAQQLLLSQQQGIYLKTPAGIKVISDEIPAAFDFKRWWIELIDLQAPSAGEDPQQANLLHFAISGWGRFTAAVHRSAGQITALEFQLHPLQITPWNQREFPASIRELPEINFPLVVWAQAQLDPADDALWSLALQFQQQQRAPVYWVSPQVRWLPDTCPHPFVMLQPGWHGASLAECVNSALSLAPGLLVLDFCPDYNTLNLALQAASAGWSVVVQIAALNANAALTWLLQAGKTTAGMLAENLQAVVVAHNGAYRAVPITPEISKLVAVSDLAGVLALTAQNSTAAAPGGV